MGKSAYAARSFVLGCWKQMECLVMHAQAVLKSLRIFFEVWPQSADSFSSVVNGHAMSMVRCQNLSLRFGTASAQHSRKHESYGMSKQTSCQKGRKSCFTIWPPECYNRQTEKREMIWKNSISKILQFKLSSNEVGAWISSTSKLLSHDCELESQGRKPRQVDHINFIHICLISLFLHAVFVCFVLILYWSCQLRFWISLSYQSATLRKAETSASYESVTSRNRGMYTNKAWVRRVGQLFQWYQWCSYFWEFKVIQDRRM